MPFILTEQWTVERASRPGLSDLSAWARRGTALALALGIDVALVYGLVTLGTLPAARIETPAAVIHAFDLSPSADDQQGARTKPAITPSPAPKTELDVTQDSPRPTEWSVVTLPPLPALAPPAAAPAPAPTPIVAVVQGTAASGTNAGSGYDPYAFASYRAPDPQRLAAARAQAQPQPQPSGLGPLEGLLRARLGVHGRSVQARLRLDTTGRITAADILTSLPQRERDVVLATLVGFQAASLGLARQPDGQAFVTLSI